MLSKSPVGQSSTDKQVSGGVCGSQDLFMSQELTIRIAGELHEVDSITDCKQKTHNLGQVNQGQEADLLRMQLEMCCSCHSGRPVWLPYRTIMGDGNRALRSLTEQTALMFRKGLEIRSTAAALPRFSKVNSNNYSNQMMPA